MPETGLKTRIVLIFMILLAIAMFLQSIVIMFLGVRASMREDVAWAKHLLQNAAKSIFVTEAKVDTRNSTALDFDVEARGYLDAFACMVVELEDMVVSDSSQCRFRRELMTVSRQTKTIKTPVVEYVGENGRMNWFGREVALISVPLVDGDGQVYGSLNAERSLLPIYARYKKDMGIALCYLLVNVIIFTTLGFFRFVRIFFKPLDKLVSMAEYYYPDDQALFPLSDNEGAFRKLSKSLNALLDRVKRDNRSLRNTVRQLEDANRELKEKNDLVLRSEKLASTGRLSAGLAHEIGNPLSIIQGYVELLAREDLSAVEKKQFSDKAQQELHRIKELIRQLLDFSGTARAGEEKIVIDHVINEVVGFVSLEKSFAECTLRTELLAEDNEAVVEKDALRQVLINVLFNAVDAVAEKEDGKEICIATYNEKSDRLGPIFVISIKDNGIGITEENLGNVFDPFFTTKEVGRGTGLGLFVCHSIMERLGGRISICNRDPYGVEVKLELPLRKTIFSQTHQV